MSGLSEIGLCWWGKTGFLERPIRKFEWADSRLEIISWLTSVSVKRKKLLKRFLFFRKVSESNSKQVCCFESLLLTDWWLPAKMLKTFKLKLVWKTYFRLSPNAGELAIVVIFEGPKWMQKLDTLSGEHKK